MDKTYEIESSQLECWREKSQSTNKIPEKENGHSCYHRNTEDNTKD